MLISKLLMLTLFSSSYSNNKRKSYTDFDSDNITSFGSQLDSRFFLQNARKIGEISFLEASEVSCLRDN